MSNQHVLKIHPAPLADLLSGAKTAEVRRNDRGFQVGDTVRLMEVNPETGNWTGADDHVRTISHIQTGYGLPEGVCVLSYAQAEQQEARGYNAYTEAPYSRTGKCGDNPVPQFRFEDRAGNAEWYVRLRDYRAALATQPAVQPQISMKRCATIRVNRLDSGRYAPKVVRFDAGQFPDGELIDVYAAVRGAEHE